jgi:hypothetical protein
MEMEPLARKVLGHIARKAVAGFISRLEQETRGISKREEQWT